MMLLAALCFCMFCATSSGLGEDPLKISLFYESYCPDCIDHFKDQVYKAWKSFQKDILLDLIPFGNADQKYVNHHWKFRCQHGPKECLGNKLHACAICQACGASGTVNCDVDHVTKVVDYVHCVVQKDDQLQGSDECARGAGLEPESIVKCAQNQQGDDLLSGYGNETKAFRPKIQYVPTVAIDGKHDRNAENDLVGEICRLRPALCTSPDVETNLIYAK